jgi:hypothetical protein
MPTTPTKSQTPSKHHTTLELLLANLQAILRIRLHSTRQVNEARYNPYLHKHSAIGRQTSYVQALAL